MNLSRVTVVHSPFAYFGCVSITLCMYTDTRSSDKTLAGPSLEKINVRTTSIDSFHTHKIHLVKTHTRAPMKLAPVVVLRPRSQTERNLQERRHPRFPGSVGKEIND